MKELKINEQVATMIGFAFKAGELVRGFEAIRRAIEKDRIAIVLIKKEISRHSIKKLEHLVSLKNIPLVQTAAQNDWNSMWGIHGHKIIGITKGNIGKTIIKEI